MATLGGRHRRREDRKMMRVAPLYRIYHIGAAEIRHRFAATAAQRRAVAAQAIAAIRAALDSGVVQRDAAAQPA